ncbi:MAG: DsrE family protein [Chromatiales bacterium]|jgi:intracellular sulfur oxidation DsrE/DsrF family protein
MRLIDSARRRFVRGSFLALLLTPLAGRVSAAGESPAPVEPAGGGEDDSGGGASGPSHRVVYQCNGGDVSYYRSLLFSVGELKEKHGDDIDIVVTCYGPGIHLLARNPRRSVPPDVLEKMSYLELFGVRFHACNNTMHALGWGPQDMHPFVEVVAIGAEDLMLLQEQGFSYISW